MKGRGGKPPGSRRPGGPPRRPGPRRDDRPKPGRRRDDRARAEAPAAPPAPAAPAAAPPPGLRLAGIEQLELRIEKLVAGGEGLARWEGVPLFVPRSAPGDRLRVRIVERRPDYGRAEILEILEPGPDRRPDPYPELAATGLCDLQHLRDEAQPRLKAEAVRETLERLGGLTLPAELEVVSGEPWGYRLRTQVHTEVEEATGGVRVGYHARGTNELVPVSRCPVLVPELEALLAELPSHLGAPGGTVPRRIDLAAGGARPGADPEGSGNLSVAPVIPGLPQGEVSLQVGGFTYFYDARCFFQGHRGLLPRLVEAVVGPAEGEEAFDLYAGVGLFALPLARRYRRVVAVEGDSISARYARTNLRRNRVANVEVVARAVETWASQLPAGADRVVVDPPRSGLSRPVLKALLERRPRRLTYVSCHPAALARDLRRLLEIYTAESVVLFDLFPQTGHMETVAQLRLA
jgi:23S rRNA (uracil1939-C5)-methyltransferase